MHQHHNHCVPGRLLCSTAQRLWNEATELYHARRFAEYDQKIQEYHQHKTECTKGVEPWPAETMCPGI